MAGQETSNRNRVRLCPPPPKDFDPLAATEEDLKRHGLPLRPDPQTQSVMAALWERKARRYRNFEHLEPQFKPATVTSLTASHISARISREIARTCRTSRQQSLAVTALRWRVAIELGT